MSAPSSSGRWKYGVMNVLSTASSTPRRLQTSATAAMSHSLSIGLVGVSTQHQLGVRPDRRLDRGARRPTGSTYVNSKPSAAVHLVEQPERAAVEVVAGDHVVAGVEQVHDGVDVAARPDAKHRPCAPPSSAARLASSAKRVGLCVREYSKPLCSPGAVLHVGRRVVDRRHHRAGDRIGRLAGVDRAGAEAERGVVVRRPSRLGSVAEA